MERKILRTREKRDHIYDHKELFIAKADPFLYHKDDSWCHLGLPSLKCTINLATCVSGNGIKAG